MLLSFYPNFQIEINKSFFFLKKRTLKEFCRKFVIYFTPIYTIWDYLPMLFFLLPRSLSSRKILSMNQIYGKSNKLFSILGCFSKVLTTIRHSRMSSKNFSCIEKNWRDPCCRNGRKHPTIVKHYEGLTIQAGNFLCMNIMWLQWELL